MSSEPSPTNFVHFLFYAPTPHLETDLEMMQDEIDAGNRVEAMVCTGQLPYCPFNPNHDWLRCRKCASKQFRGLARIRGQVKVRRLEGLSSKVPSEISGLDDLRRHKFLGVNIGIGTLSDMIGRHGYVFELPGRETEMENVLRAQRILVSSLVNQNIGQDQTLVIFNGRFSLFRTLVEYAQEKDVPFRTHERGGTVDRYSLREGAIPHDIGTTTKEMNSLWSQVKEPEKFARQWFEDRRNRVQQNWTVFTQSQTEGLLPPGFDTKKRNIAIFNSTIEEYETIDCWKNHLFQDEVIGLKVLMDKLSNWTDFHFYVRLHPNLKNYESGPQMQFIRRLEIPANFTMIWPEEKIHSYALLDHCEKVATFGSTIGLEAVYWQRPSVLMGRALYQDMRATYNPEALEELWSMLAEDLAPRPIDGALKYGLWEAQRGRVFRYFQPDGLFAGTFKGRKLLHHPFWELVTQILALGQKLKRKFFP